MNEKRVFKRFMLRYLLVGFLVLAGSIPFILMSYKHIYDYTISDNVSNLQSGISELENNFQKMNMISLLMNEEQNLRTLKQINGDISIDKYLNLKYLAKQMFNLKCVYDFSPMFFVIFENNNAFVSTDQVSDDFMKYYGKFLEAEGMTSEEFRNVIFDKERKSPFIYVKRLKYYLTNREVVTKNAVLYIEPVETENAISASKAVMVFIMNEKKIVETLLNSKNINQAVTRITDSEGDIIVNYGDYADKLSDSDIITTRKYLTTETDKLRLITYDNIKKDLTITIGFPMTLIRQQMVDIIRLLLIYLGIGIILALIITIAFSLHWYAPFSNMLKEVASLSSTNITKKNEFDYIRESVLRLVSAKDEMETKMLLADTQKQAIMLENIFIKGFYKKEEEKDFLRNYPLVKNGYYVAYLQINYEDGTDKDHKALITAIEILEKQFREGFIHVHAMVDTEILLIPVAEGIHNEALKDIFENMNHFITGQFPLRCYVGISQRESEICNINVAYAHARQTVHAYKNLNTSFVEFYHYMNDQEIGCFHMGFLNKLYELILCSGKGEIRKLYEEMKEECKRHKEQYEFHKSEIFHAISFTNYTALQQLSFASKDTIEFPEYQQNHSLIECLDLLESTAYHICDKIDDNKRSKNIELKNRILDYLHHNFRRAELTADIASQEVGISEKYLSTFLKEHTGKTFSLYLDELRIGYAKECLEAESWSNDKIAVEAGFGAENSFYRVFKKYVGVSPSIYKKSKRVL